MNIRSKKAGKVLAASTLAVLMSGTSVLATCPLLGLAEVPANAIVLNMSGGGSATLTTKSGTGAGYRNEGYLLYNRTAKEMQYCNGTDWVSMKAGADGAAGGGASCPSQTLTWGNCSYNIASEPDGTARTATDPFTVQQCRSVESWGGTRDYTCNNGTWTPVNAGSCTYERRSHYDELQCRGSCFTADTLVAMADGTFKAIHRIVVGDKLRGADGCVVTVLALDRPKLFKGKDQRMIKLNGGKEFTTDNHPLMTKDGWKAVYPEMAEREDYDALQGKVGKLEVGDEIITADGSMLVESIEVLEHDGNERRLYNLLVSGDNAYFANNILAHGAKMDALGRFPLARDHNGEPEPVALAAA